MKTTKLAIAVAISGLTLGVPLFGQPAQQPTTSAPSSSISASQPSKPCVAEPSVASLRQVKRIYVDSFGEDAVSRQIQAMVVSQLVASQRFLVTENKEKADAIFRGSALEKTSQESHAYNSATSGGHVAGGHSGNVSGTFVNGTGSVSGSSSGGFAGTSAAISDSYASTETINDARIAVRLVNQDGDVIWATAQDSHGAKYKGASADVADKVVKQLMRDAEKLELKPAEAANAVK